MANRIVTASRRVAQILSRPWAARCRPRRVVFLHIPRAGGSSLVDHFRRRLGRPWMGQMVSLEDRSAERAVSLAAGARFVGGHFGAEMLVERIRNDAVVLTVLREPLERIVSAWRYARTIDKPTLRPPFERLEQALASENPLVIESLDNVLARQLAGAFDPSLARRIPRDEWVERAIECLGRMDVVAVTARLDGDFHRILDAAGLPASAAARLNAADGAERKNRDPTSPLPVIPEPRRSSASPNRGSPSTGRSGTLGARRTPLVHDDAFSTHHHDRALPLIARWDG